MVQEKETQIRPNTQVLVLNASYEPLHITSWKRAIVLLLKEKATIISARVIRLLDYIKLPVSKMRIARPSRSQIYKRDGHKCQYCGSTRSLTIDHVVPKSKGGGDTWDNMVVACSTCNTKKANRYLEQTGMRLARKPQVPYNKVVILLNDTCIQEWQQYSFV